MSYDTNNGSRKPFKVYFSRKDTPLKDEHLPAILLYPASDSWNDFNYKCRYNFHIYYDHVQYDIRGQVFLGFLSEDEHIDASGKISDHVDLIESNELPNFFTLQGEMQDYRKFIEQNGIDESQYILLALNDLVASKRVSKKLRLVEAAQKTDVFNLAFMRESGRFFAFHNADSILDGVDAEIFSNISTNLSLSYQVAGFSEKHIFDMNFDAQSTLPKRICVLIGRNGLGKSQALRSIVNSLVKDSNDFYDIRHGRPMISRLLAIATPGETINTFPAENTNYRIKYRRLILNRSARTKHSRGFCELCVQLIRSEESIGTHERWDLFKDSINFLPNIENIVVPLDKGITVSTSNVINVRGKNYIPLLRLNHGGEQAKL
ncbi:ATP-binding cassette domain-containing protein, partial [Aeromonas molluscorum]|uniref:hypothetical protein n=1 Tax=Aeromonas molluscorum TaxID=271417 RepID=UPI00191C6BFF